MWRKSWVAVACVSVMLGAAAHGCGGGDNTVPNEDMGTKYHMEGLANQPGFTQTPMAILMNKQKYESLPAELKAAIDKHSGAALSNLAGSVWDQGNDAARTKMTAQGNKVLVIKPEDYAAMKKAGAGVEADWIKQAEAKGLDGKKLAAEVHAIGNKYLSK